MHDRYVCRRVEYIIYVIIICNLNFTSEFSSKYYGDCFTAPTHCLSLLGKNLSCSKSHECEIKTNKYIPISNFSMLSLKGIVLNYSTKAPWICFSWHYLGEANTMYEGLSSAYILLSYIIYDGSTDFCCNFLVPYKFFIDGVVLHCINIRSNYSPKVSINTTSSLFLKPNELSDPEIFQSLSFYFELTGVPRNYSFEPQLPISKYDRITNNLTLTLLGDSHKKCLENFPISILEVHNKSLKAIYNGTLKKEKVEQILSVDNNRLKSLRNYQVIVTRSINPKCHSNDIINITNILFLKALPNCRNWNATLVLTANSTRQEIIIEFQVDLYFETCFTGYNFSLFKSEDCSIGGSEIAKFYVKQNKKNIVIQKLKPSAYCIQVMPYHPKCYKCYSYVLYSKITRIIENPTIHEKLILDEFQGDLSNETIIGISVLFSVLLAAVTLLLWKRNREKKCLSRYDSVLSSEESFTPPEQCRLVKPDRVYILYSHDKITRTRVEALADFLKDCAGFEVVLDSYEDAQIDINPQSWIADVLKYSCTRKGDAFDQNKRIIVVESMRAVRYQQHCMRVVSGNISYNDSIEERSEISSNEDIDDEFLEGVFKRALFSIIIMEQSLFDVCHLFVARFEDSINSNYRLENLVPNVRYRIPEDLIDLCSHLSSSKSFSGLNAKRELLRRLRNHAIMNFSTNNSNT